MQPHYHEDWTQWPYVTRAGHPNIAAFPPYGYPTITQTDAYRVIGYPPRPKIVNHTMHFVATLFTLGLWFPFWIIITVVTQTRNTRVDADYWTRIQRYRQWELEQQRYGERAAIPPPRDPAQGG